MRVWYICKTSFKLIVKFVYDTSTEPSIFYGDYLSQGIKETFKQIGKRFTFGGESKDQRVYYINKKEIIGNKLVLLQRFHFLIF